MENQYYLRTRHGEFGPMSVSELQRCGEGGQIEPDDLVRRDGSKNWHEAADVKGLVVQSVEAMPVAQSVASRAMPQSDLAPVSSHTAAPYAASNPAQAPPPYMPSVYAVTPRRTNSVAITSLVLGFIAFLFCWIPLLALISLPISIGGIVLGIVGLAIGMSRRGAGVGFAIGGGLISGVALAVTLIMHSVIILGAAEVAGAAVRSNSGSNAKESESKAVRAKWSSSSSEGVLGDIQIKVLGVELGQVQLSTILGPQYLSDDHYLVVKVALRNNSANKKYRYFSWDSGPLSLSDKVKLTDEHGNTYGPSYSDNIVDQLGSHDLYPGDVVTDIIVIERPVASASQLELYLPGDNVQQEGALRLAITKDGAAVAPSSSTTSQVDLPSEAESASSVLGQGIMPDGSPTILELVPFLSNKRISQRNGNEYILFDIEWDLSSLPKLLTKADGKLIFINIEGKRKMNVRWTVDANRQIGAGLEYDNRFPSHAWLQNTDLESVFVQFEIDKITYSDGTTIEF